MTIGSIVVSDIGLGTLFVILSDTLRDILSGTLFVILSGTVLVILSGTVLGILSGTLFVILSGTVFGILSGTVLGILFENSLEKNPSFVLDDDIGTGGITTVSFIGGNFIEDFGNDISDDDIDN
jgi:hypothetical protein